MCDRHHSGCFRLGPTVRKWASTVRVKHLNASSAVSELSRLRRARLSKARNQRRPSAPSRLDEGSDSLTRSWSVTKSLTLKAFGVWSVLTSIALSAVGTLLFVALSYLLYQSVTSSAIEVAPISVPKDLADKGYTSEAVTLELREALLDLVKEARTQKRTLNVVSQKDEPAIDLPQTGMSLDTVAAEIRERFGLGNSWRVSSSIELVDDRLKLRISLNSNREHAKEIVIYKPLSQIDELFSSAAHDVFEVIDPYFIAAIYAQKDEIKSIELAKRIILADSPDNSNAAWAHILIGYVHLRHKN